MIATDWNSLQIWWHAQLIPDTDQSSLNWGHGITEAIFSLRVWLWWKWIPQVEVYLSRKEVSFWPQATGWGHTQPLTEATQWLRPLLLTTSTKRPPIPKNMWKGPETEIFCFFPLNYCQSYLRCHCTSEAFTSPVPHPYFGFSETFTPIFWFTSWVMTKSLL